MHCVRGTCLLQNQITIEHQNMRKSTRDYSKVLLHINSRAPWESPSCTQCAETSVRRRPRRGDHFTCIQGVPEKCLLAEQ